MAKEFLLVGTTSWIDYVRIVDVNGSPITGLVYNSTGLLAKYVLAGASSVAITLATQTVTGAYSSGGFVEVDATAFPGLYRFDIPNAAIASGNKAFVSLYGYSGMNVSMLEYELVAFNPQNATSMGLTAVGVDLAASVVMAELGSIPAATPTPAQALMLAYEALRNQLTTTANAKTIFNSAGSALGSKVLSDDGTTYTEAKLA